MSRVRPAQEESPRAVSSTAPHARGHEHVSPWSGLDLQLTRYNASNDPLPYLLIFSFNYQKKKNTKDPNFLLLIFKTRRKKQVYEERKCSGFSRENANFPNKKGRGDCACSSEPSGSCCLFVNYKMPRAPSTPSPFSKDKPETTACVC